MRAAAEAPAPAALVARVVRLFHRSPDFSAGRARPDGAAEFSFTAPCEVGEGLRYEFAGGWVEHGKFGRQFQSVACSPAAPASDAGLASFLSERLAGVGPVKASRLVDALGGLAGFEASLGDPDALLGAALASGADHGALAALARDFSANRAAAGARVALAAMGCTAFEAGQLLGQCGNGVVETLREAPYSLLGRVPRIGFARLDGIALRSGLDPGDPSRLEAGAWWAYSETVSASGSTALGLRDLASAAGRLLKLPKGSESAALRGVSDAVASGRLTLFGDGESEPLAASPQRLAEERLLCGAMRRMGASPCPPAFTRGEMESACSAQGSPLSADQRAAVELACSRGFVAVTGPAGSGKTTLVEAVKRVWERRGLKVALLAPTGKAAKRLSQRAGEALTVHRALGYDGKIFAKAELDADLVVVDEASMVDASLGHHLARRLAGGAAMLWVGDFNQLPPVGAGSPFHDAVRLGAAPVARLDRVHRQGVDLAGLCGEILRGRVPGTVPGVWEVHDGGAHNDAAHVLRTLDGVVAGLAREGFDVLRDVVVLSPTRLHALGVGALNRRLQPLAHMLCRGERVDRAPAEAPIPFLPGDRVMQTANDYELEVMNGDQGVVVWAGGGRVKAAMDGGGEVEFPKGHRLTHAFACTVHKAQGSEWEVAVVVAHRSQSFMLNKNLLYTACTRARQRVVLLGDSAGMRRAAFKDAPPRRTVMAAMLSAESSGRALAQLPGVPRG